MSVKLTAFFVILAFSRISLAQPEVGAFKVCAGEVSKASRYPTTITTIVVSVPGSLQGTIHWKHGRDTILTLKQGCNPEATACYGADQYHAAWVIYPRLPHGHC